MTTRADFYARKNAGSLRTARKAFTCMQFSCFKKIEPGEQYFDTREVLTWPTMKRICVCCSEVKI